MARKRKDDNYDGPNRRAAAQLVVVNDEENAAELLSRLLVKAGYRVSAAHNYEVAMGKLVELLPRGVVLDLTQGGIGSNLKLLESIRHHHDQRIATSRILLVARQAANRMFSFQSGADAFLVRPFHANDLLEAVDQVLSMPFADLPQHRRSQLDTHRPLREQV